MTKTSNFIPQDSLVQEIGRLKDNLLMTESKLNIIIKEFGELYEFVHGKNSRGLRTTLWDEEIPTPKESITAEETDSRFWKPLKP